MHIDGRSAGSAPNCLIDYFPDDFLLVIDESHLTVPQIGAMYEGDMSRKRMLVDHGFRLPSAMDNRPLMWEEFLDRIGQTLYLSATPGPLRAGQGASRRRRADHPADRPGRPARSCSSRPRARSTTSSTRSRCAPERNERILVTTLTKKMAEDLTDYLLDKGIRVRYLHSEIDTLRRVELLRELRTGRVRRPRRHQPAPRGPRPARGVAGLHPRRRQGGVPALGAQSLIQTIGRAARNVSGQVHMYADNITPSMQQALDETTRRREKQIAFNKEHGVDPQPLRKKIADITDLLAREDADTEQLLGSGRSQSRGRAPRPAGGRGRWRPTSTCPAAAGRAWRRPTWPP